MDRSRYIFTQNKLLIFVIASVVIHLMIFAGLKIDFRTPVRIDPVKYTVRLKTIEQEKEIPPPPAVLAEPVEKIQPEALPEPVAEITEAEPEAVSPAEEPVPDEASAAEAVPAVENLPLPEEVKPVILGSIGTVSIGEQTAAPSKGAVSTGTAEFISYDSLAVPGVKVPKPQYPDLARRWGHEGTVVLEILIFPDGSIKGTRILKSSGFDELDSAARQVVLKRWKFQEQGREVTTKKEFEFKLRGQ